MTSPVVDLRIGICGRRVHCVLKHGEVLWVRGPNGAGKTTLLNAVVQRLPEELTGYVPQLLRPRIHLSVTLGEVLELYASRRVDNSAIADFGLLEPKHLALAWRTASGGERMRTLLMAALMRSPEILVLDEPLNHLDSASRARVQSALRKYLAERSSRSLLVVSHDELKLGDRTVRELLLEAGEE